MNSSVLFSDAALRRLVEQEKATGKLAFARQVSFSALLALLNLGMSTTFARWMNIYVSLPCPA